MGLDNKGTNLSDNEDLGQKAMFRRDTVRDIWPIEQQTFDSICDIHYNTI
jgi:hypothetical protein